MSIIVLIAALVCTVALLLQTPSAAFRNVALPVVLLCPMIYFWKAPMLPPIDFADAVLLPLGIAMVLRCLPRWRLSIMDAWIMLFLVSTGWADHSSGSSTASTFELFDAVCFVVIPYMAGKVLIEQEDARLLTVRRIVHLLFAGSFIAIFEYFASRNPFEILFSRFFQDKIFFWASQFRDGRARITGPFWQAELAGTMIVIGILLALWLAFGDNRRQRPQPTGLFARRPAAAIGGLLVALVLTQSRGPELGLLAGVPIALLGRSKRLLRAAVLVALLLAAGGSAAYFGIMKYAATGTPSSEQQQSARYRAVMLDNYLPRAEHSGPWGLGPNFPRVGGQVSIDNEYLWLTLTQGWIGVTTFLLLSGGTIYNLVRAAARACTQADRSFAFTLLGIFLGELFILATVFLAYQPRIFFFLIVGWSQALRVQPRHRKKHAFEQIFT